MAPGGAKMEQNTLMNFNNKWFVLHHNSLYWTWMVSVSDQVCPCSSTKKWYIFRFL